MSNNVNSDEGNPDAIDLEITKEDCLNALKDIADADPDLIEYIITYYPPELMINISPQIWQNLEQLKKSLSLQELLDFYDSLKDS